MLNGDFRRVSMKKAVRKNFFREIKDSRGRFFSILFISALGVAFLSGIKAAEPDIRASLDSYYDRTGLSDVSIQGTLGLTLDDLAAVKKVPGVKDAEAVKTVDVLYDLKGSQNVLHFISMSKDMNKPEIEEGSLPADKDECALDAGYASRNKIKPGDKLKVYLDSDVTDTLATDTFTVTGLVSSSMYVSFSKGSSQIGQGEVSAFVFVPESSFVTDTYTQIDILADGAAEQTAYTDGYTSIVEKLEDSLKKTEDERCKARYDEVRGDAQKKIDDAQKKIDDNTKTLEENKKKLEDSQAEYDSGVKKLYDNQKAYDDAEKSTKSQFKAAEDQLAGTEALLGAENPQYQAALETYNAQKKAAEAKLSDSRTQLDAASQTLADAKKKIDDGLEDIADAEKKLDDAKNEISDNQKKVDDIEYPKWYVTDREDLPQYTQCGDNALSIGAVGNVFPVIFFLVAALIALTTMTRMVEEERTQIGIMAALGYNRRTIIGKYIWYAVFATCAGCVLGVLAGEKIFPYVIVYSYQIMTPYATDIVMPYRLSYGIAASAAAIGCVIAATLWACNSELTAVPSSLMRPVPPRNGKRILLERASAFWKRLSFSQKSTFRNLFRYKKRLYMTVFGIGGCTALMLVGFGIKDSIEEIADLQYKDIQLYQGMIIYDGDKAGTDTDAYLAKQKDTDYGQILFDSISAGSADSMHDCYILVPEDTEDFSKFVTLRTRKGHENISLTEDTAASGTDDSIAKDTADGVMGAVVTEKLAKMADLNVGDTITITRDSRDYKVKISAITENYLYHYIYMSPECYSSVFGVKPDYNADIYKTSSSDENVYKKVGKDALGIDGVVRVSYASASRSQLDSMLSALDTVIIVLVVAAGMLAFVVIYNLNNININERQRELATLKVLGFYDSEVAMYVYRENIWLTLAGCAAGCLMGSILHRFIIETVEIDTCMFGRNIAPASYLYSTLLTLLFAVVVNLVMFFKLKQIDMIASLKSAE